MGIVGIEVAGQQKNLAFVRRLGKSTNIENYRIRRRALSELGQLLHELVSLLAAERAHVLEIIAFDQRFAIGFRLEINGNLSLGVFANENRNKIGSRRRPDEIDNPYDHARQGQHNGQERKNLLAPVGGGTGARTRTGRGSACRGAAPAARWIMSIRHGLSPL